MKESDRRATPDRDSTSQDIEHQGASVAQRLKERLKPLFALWEWLTGTRVWRSLQRYNHVRGPLLAGGIAYTGLFSLFSSLAIGMSLFMATLGKHRELREAVVEEINTVLPGVLRTQSNSSGLVSIDQLTLSSAVNLGSILAMAVLAYSAFGLVGTIARGIRAMFDLPPREQNWFMAQLRAAAGFGVLLISVAMTAASSVLVGGVLSNADIGPQWFQSFIGGAGNALAALIALIIDAAVVASLIRLAGVRPPRRDALFGCIIAAVCFSLLRYAGVGIVKSAVDKPVLASFAALLIVVVWLHLGGRILLMACAWIANPPEDPVVPHPADGHEEETPNYITLSDADTLEWEGTCEAEADEKSCSD